MTRKLLAVLLGWVVAFAVVALIEAAGHKVYPPPPDLDFTDSRAVAEYLQLMPLGALFFLLAAWTLAALIGGLTACRIAGEKPLLFATLVGSVVLAATIVNLVMLPHPAWVSISAVVGIVVATFLAARISSSS